ncbi:MAG: carbohydrate kinase family protein [Ignavibacteriaceae bacterium]|nr:carbohydrate kinase family protein [Ignavibacteriaceae bacterium]
MKILLVGHSVEDHIIKDGVEVIQPGGLYYSAIGAASAKEDEDEIFIHTAIKKNYKLFDDVYSAFNKKFVEDGANVPEVHLTIHPDKEREERYSNLLAKLHFPHDYDEKFDGILVNMITGFEMEPVDLQKIRDRFNGLIYLDLHSLARGINEKMERIFRPVPQKDEWLRCVDILQVNENEILTLSGKKNIIETAKEIIAFGIKILLVTKGEYGVRAYYKNGDEIESIYISAEKIIVKNKIGCGDIFGAVFFYNYINEPNLMNALQMANRAASIAVSYDKFTMFKNLKNDVY